MCDVFDGVFLEFEVNSPRAEKRGESFVFEIDLDSYPMFFSCLLSLCLTPSKEAQRIGILLSCFRKQDAKFLSDKKELVVLRRFFLRVIPVKLFHLK